MPGRRQEPVGLEVDVVADPEGHVRPARWYLVPGLCLVQERLVHPDVDRREHGRTPDRDARRPSMKVHGLPRLRPGALGEHDQAFPGLQGRDRLLDHLVRRGIADVPRRLHDPPRERVGEQGGLDHARRSGREGDDENHVDEGRVIGDDQLGGAPEAVAALEFVADAPQTAHDGDEQPERSLHERARAGAAPPAAARPQHQRRKHQQT